MRYCSYCGNVKVMDDKPCAACNAVLTGPLDLAHKVWLKLSETDRRCCGSLATDKSHLLFHGKYWEGSYPEDNSTVSVECGVSLFANHAQTYYIYDTDGDCGGTDYGDTIPLPDPDNEASWNAFYVALHAQLDKAAEAAFNNDLYDCETCGYHAHCGAPHEHADEGNGD